MTVKDIFDLRKQGRIEEAYDAIRPMYAVHKGRYTTLCMFWTAADVFKLRLEQDRTEEAEKILEALKRMQPRVEAITKELDSEYAAPAKSESKLPWEHDEKNEGESAAERFIQYATRRLEEIPSSEDNDTDEESTRLINSDQSPKEKKLPDFAKQEEKNSSREEDLTSHLTVSLEDGIIRPIEGINAPQRVVLACLVAHPGYSIQQIADSTGLPAPNVERHIEVLIARELVEQRDSEHYFGKYNNV